MPDTPMDPERIRAALRMLTESGDITPMGVRLIEQAIEPTDPATQVGAGFGVQPKEVFRA